MESFLPQGRACAAALREGARCAAPWGRLDDSKGAIKKRGSKLKNNMRILGGFSALEMMPKNRHDERTTKNAVLMSRIGLFYRPESIAPMLAEFGHQQQRLSNPLKTRENEWRDAERSDPYFSARF